MPGDIASHRAAMTIQNILRKVWNSTFAIFRSDRDGSGCEKRGIIRKSRTMKASAFGALSKEPGRPPSMLKSCDHAFQPRKGRHGIARGVSPWTEKTHATTAPRGATQDVRKRCGYHESRTIDSSPRFLDPCRRSAARTSCATGFQRLPPLASVGRRSAAQEFGGRACCVPAQANHSVAG